MMANNTETNLLANLFEEYIAECQYSKQLRPQTIVSYRDVFTTLQKVVPELVSLSDLNAGMIHEFFKRLSLRKGYHGSDRLGVKASTIRTYYNRLISFFRWLEREEHIKVGHLTKKVVKPAQPVYEDERALSDEEVSKIITSISLYTMDKPFLYARDISIVYTLLLTGIRKGELLGLRVHDVDLSSRILFINGSTSKSKKSRKIPIHPTLAMYLYSYLELRRESDSTSEYLWLSAQGQSPLTKHGIKHWVDRYKSLSGVPFHLHRFRHTFACRLARNNADVVSIKSVMGHSSIRMTERYLRSIGSENARSFIESLSC